MSAGLFISGENEAARRAADAHGIVNESGDARWNASSLSIIHRWNSVLHKRRRVVTLAQPPPQPPPPFPSRSVHCLLLLSRDNIATAGPGTSREVQTSAIDRNARPAKAARRMSSNYSIASLTIVNRRRGVSAGVSVVLFLSSSSSFLEELSRRDSICI